MARQPVRGEQRVEPPLAAALDPLLGSLAGPDLADAAEHAHAPAGALVVRLEGQRIARYRSFEVTHDRFRPIELDLAVD